MPGVATVGRLRTSAAKLVPGGVEARVRGIDPATLPALYKLPITSGPDDAVSRMDGDGTILNKDFAKDHHLKVGSTLRVRTPTNRVATLRVVGLTDDSDRRRRRR